MKKILMALVFSVSCFSQSFSEFDVYQGKLSKGYVSSKIAHFLKDSAEIEAHYAIIDDALALYATAEDKAKDHAEYRLTFGSHEPQPVSFNRPLSQARIAIDPGHFGGPLARLEERYVEMENVYFDEGSLTFLTALKLKKRLEEQGATVFLTRQAIGQGVYPENFFDWLKNHPEYWKKGVALSTIFVRHYNRLDLQARAERINAFKPDLTLLIHYNAIDSELEGSKWTKATKRNFNLVFIPGAFCSGELKNQEDRYHFLRLICTQDLETSYQMAEKLVQQFTEHLGVPPLKGVKRSLSSFGHNLVSAEGVFCRNLCLTRLIKGPLCYGETLIQNNLEEAIELSKNETSVQGIPCPKRVVAVAEAYFEAIASFYSLGEK